jgi:hypothetical protein
LLQALLQALTPPFTAFGHDFAFEVGQTGERLGSRFRFHMTTQLPWLLFLPVEEPLRRK